MKTLLLGASALLLIAACGGENTGSKTTTPGADESGKTRALEAGAALLQDKAPLGQFNAYLDGFHFAGGNLKAQMEAHHYCGHFNEEVIQCVLFDGNEDESKVVGIEYIVSAELFAKLPAEEKHLWHSHVHEVKSGQLVAPGIPLLAEHELMEKLVGTYGKTWHTWHSDEQNLPLGIPKLMMGFTADGQVDENRVRERDERFGISSAERRDNRRDITPPVIDTDADAWQKGISLQLEVKRVPLAR